MGSALSCSDGTSSKAHEPQPVPAAAKDAPAANEPAKDENPEQYLASYNELKVKEAFAAYDLDKNGAIDAKELGES